MLTNRLKRRSSKKNNLKILLIAIRTSNKDVEPSDYLMLFWVSPWPSLISHSYIKLEYNTHTSTLTYSLTYRYTSIWPAEVVQIENETHSRPNVEIENGRHK